MIKIDDLKSAVADLKSMVDDLKSSVDYLKSSVDYLNKKIDALFFNVVGEKSAVGALKSKVSGLVHGRRPLG